MTREREREGERESGREEERTHAVKKGRRGNGNGLCVELDEE
jgi:hypothetical protein